MHQEFRQVDAFTDTPFAGNPAAVCIMEEPADEQRMQQVAREMNLSETAFVWPVEDGNLSLRWFTPAVEVDLCGHATLAAAHVLWESGKLSLDSVAKFTTRSGLLTARRDGEWIELDFPALVSEIAKAPAGLIESLGDAARSRVTAVAKNKFDYLVELDMDQAEFAALSPDLPTLAKVEARGLIITTRRASDAKFDFVSRFFGPRCGIGEDPATGSAHCALAPWWRDRLGKETMLAYQASERGGVVRVSVRGDRVLLEGQAVTVIKGIVMF